MQNFEWVDFYEEFAKVLLSYKNNRQDVISKIKQIYSDAQISLPTLEQSNNIVDIDPFTVFGLFNKGIKESNRIKIINGIASKFNINAAVPASFDSVPTLNNQNATFYLFVGDRGNNDIDNLWELFDAAIRYAQNPSKQTKTTFSKYFDICINLKGNGNSKITMGLYWIFPDVYLNLDDCNKGYIYNSGEIPASVIQTLPNVKGKLTADTYFEITDKLNAFLNSGASSITNFKELSLKAKAWEENANKTTADKQTSNKRLGFIEYCKNNGISKAATQYENGLRALETEFAVNADDEYTNDRCETLMQNVTNMKNVSGNRKNWSFYLRTFIKYKDSLNNTANIHPPAYITKYAKTLRESYNIIFRGAPGTGKSHLAKQIAANIVSDNKISKYDYLSDEQKKQIEFVQFHPSYDYSDFVEGLRPVKMGAKGTDIGFELRNGVFKAFADNARAAENKDKEYIFIIDEINRGEISKILGELFFAIDPGYRGKAGEVSTQYSNLHDDPTEKFYIPENLYIIGTMNDIDRSVDTFDFAMRRRFRFIEIKAEDRLEMLDILPEPTRTQAITRMKSLNDKIVATEGLNENYQIGAAYFLKLEKLSFDELWEDYLKPLLQEYVNGISDDNVMKDFENAYNLKVTANDAIDD